MWASTFGTGGHDTLTRAPFDPRHRPGHHRHHLHRLRRRGPPGRARLPRVRAALPQAGLGRARRERDLGERPRGGQGGAGRRGAPGHRHHQPARDRRGLGPLDRRAGAPRAGVAGPPHLGPLRRAQGGGPRAAVPRAHRAGARPLLLRARKIEWLVNEGHGDALLRDDRLVARAQAVRRARDRLHQRLAHAAVRHPRAQVGPRAVRDPPRRPRLAARAATQRRGGGGDERVRRQRAAGRHGRRPAGRPLRPGLPRGRAGQEHLRHGLVRAPARRGRGAQAARRPAHHRSPRAPSPPTRWRPRSS